MTNDVCGVPFELKETESNGREDPSMGICDSKLAIIKINKEMSEPMKESVLIHEWLHGVLDANGLGELSGKENLVCVLQTELYRNGFRIKVRR